VHFLENLQTQALHLKKKSGESISLHPPH
jgi:hypothetical protein